MFIDTECDFCVLNLHNTLKMNIKNNKTPSNEVQESNGDIYSRPTGEPALVSTKRLAEILGCGPYTITRVYIPEGMPCMVKGAKNSCKPRYQFNPVACLRWMEENRAVVNN